MMADKEESSEGERELSKAADRELVEAIIRNDAARVQRSFRNGANVNHTRFDMPPLAIACHEG